MIDTHLAGKVVLVTGANHGIGAATARAFGAEGAKVFVAYLSLEPDTFGIDAEEAHRATAPGMAFMCRGLMESGDEVVNAIREDGGRAEAFEADLSEPERIPELFDCVEAALGPVDVLVNNATHTESVDTLDSLTGDTMDRYYAVNTRGTTLMMKEYLARHEAHGHSWGRIINLSQDHAQCSGVHIAYSSTKATIEMLTRSVASAAGRRGVTVNAVAPGPVQTGYIRPDQEVEWGQGIPLGRVGQPEDIARAIVFLASSQADWITGQILKVDGGNALGCL